MSETFKFPTGDFSHTDFAQLNGKTNQQVWVRYSAARKSGEIIPADPPTKKTAGKGKPTLMWKVNPNYVPTETPAPVAEVKPTAPVIEVKTVEVKPEPIEIKQTPTATPEQLAHLTVDPVSGPAPTILVVNVEPVVEPMIIPIIQVVPETNPEATVVNQKVKVSQDVLDASELDEKCPICGQKVLSLKDATGYMVWCAQPVEVCKSAESPFGHGKSPKAAYEILCQRFGNKEVAVN